MPRSTGIFIPFGYPTASVHFKNCPARFANPIDPHAVFLEVALGQHSTIINRFQDTLEHAEL